MITLKDLSKKQKETSDIPIYRVKFYASVFNNIDRANDRMIKGAFKETKNKLIF
jgi:hypothetical protein